MLKNCINKFREIVNKKYYVIGITSLKNVMSSSEYFFNNIQWVDTGTYKSGWFADPFILSKKDNIIEVLAEEKVYKLNRGRIVKLTIDSSTYKLLDIKPVLQLDTHLSFPYIYRENGKVYVCPENRQSGELAIYEYSFEKECLFKIKTIIQEPLIDPQIIKVGEEYFLFAVCQEDGARYDSNLRVYKSDSLFGPYKKIQSLNTSKRLKRGAGSIVKLQEKYMRPSQDCEKSYGDAVVLNEMQFDGDLYSEREIQRLKPIKNMIYGKGLHTFSVFQDICIVDGKEYKNRRLRKLVNVFTRYGK